MKNLAIDYGTKLLKAIANEKRLAILYFLIESELCVSELEKKVKLSQSALSQHLAILRKENIVKTRRDAQTIYYSIKSNKSIRVLKLLDDLYNQQYR
jgi:DNA-binding transcriptional ArsR family regulator